MAHFKTLTDFARASGYPPPENPMIQPLRCGGQGCPLGGGEFTGDFYMISFKKLKSGVILYGRTKYDSDNGSMNFFKPRQVLQFRDMELEADGFNLFIAEDYLLGTTLHEEMQRYSFFDYETNEALHLSPREEETMWELFFKIQSECNNNADEFSKDIILAHIDSILKYSLRFYKRQFINRKDLSGRTVSRFNEVLRAYFDKGSDGLPTVNGIASELHLSVRYLSDLLKQETGKTAIELIHIYLISEAKNRLKLEGGSVSQIAYDLGFENLPYFSRLFKKEVGMSPNQFKKQVLN